MSQRSVNQRDEKEGPSIINHQSPVGNEVNITTIQSVPESGSSTHIPVVLSSTPAKSASSSSSSLSGKPKFVRIKLLGKGGCAEVYLARERESSNLLVRMILESDYYVLVTS
jgi:hypothetical protein